jgi:hypothetical protein
MAERAGWLGNVLHRIQAGDDDGGLSAALFYCPVRGGGGWLSYTWLSGALPEGPTLALNFW